MPHKVKGIIARAKSAPVSSVDILVPDPGPGEALIRVQALRGLPHRPALPWKGPSATTSHFCWGTRRRASWRALGSGVQNVAPRRFRGARLARPLRHLPVLPSGAALVTVFASRNASQPMTLEDGTPLSPALGIGAFAELTLVDAAQAVKVNPAINPEAAGLIGCGIMAGLGAAINTGGVSRGDSVAVFGCGGVGDAAIAGSRLAGASYHHRGGHRRQQTGMGQGFRSHPYNQLPECRPGAGYQGITGGNGVNVAIEAVGNPVTYEQAFYARDHAGNVSAGGSTQPGDENRVTPVWTCSAGAEA